MTAVGAESVAQAAAMEREPRGKHPKTAEVPMQTTVAVCVCKAVIMSLCVS